MSRNKRRKANPFWIGFSDLMTSLFFVFLVIASFLAFGYKAQAERFKADSEELKRIQEIARATDILKDGGRFNYNTICDRFELANEFTFPSKSNVIPDTAKPNLIAAGKDIDRLLKSTINANNVRYKILIEGRAAMHTDNSNNGDENNRNKELSYLRALAVQKLWEANGLDFNSGNSEIFAAGSGFEGRCRYAFKVGEEGKNKRIIVQVIPFLVSQ